MVEGCEGAIAFSIAIKLFPYSWQVCITSSEVLKEFLGYFAKILMEQQ
ncbi:hypothetical protein LC607_21480 [Nostoc sp. CHAB 5824]|nr:hypothetical protein [Nostoc sp. CHAB 5824]